MTAFALFWLGLFLPLGQVVESPASRGTEGSYLNTSFEAGEALAAAQRILEKSQYLEAASAFQEVAERYGNFLISDRTEGYVNIRAHVNRQICAWSPGALEAYRQVYDAPALEAFAMAADSEDLVGLLNVADRYFATQAGARALELAAQIAIERGDLACAVKWYEELLTRHPNAGDHAADWLARETACKVWLGYSNWGEIAAGPATLKSRLVTVKGDRVSFGDYLERLRQESKQISNVPVKFSTPAAFAGGEDRRGMFQTSALPEARLWQFTDFGRPSLESIFDGYESQIARRDAITRALQSGRLLASVAVAAAPVPGAGPWIYLSDGSAAWAIDPQRPEKAIWRFEIAGGATSRQGWTAEEDTPPLYTCLVAQGRVFVALERELTRAGSDQSLVTASLLCLDAASGAEIWRNNLEGLMTEFEETRLDGAPVLHKDKLFAVARRRKPFGFEACYLLRINLKTGVLESSVHVGEAATGSYGYHRATLSHAAACDDLVFVASNLGTVAAVNVFTGRLAWLRTYESRYSEAPEGLWPTRMGRPARSWHYQPVMLWRDCLLMMPLDAEEIFLLQQSDGRQRERISLDALHMPEMLLGIDGNHLYAAGSQIVCYDLARREILWQRAIEDGQLFGRGALTTNGVLVPTDQALLCYPLTGGSPRIQRWSNEDAGNLSVLSDQIVCTSALSVSGLMSKDEAFARLERRMHEAPADPNTALAVADLAFSMMEYERGLNAVRQALDRCPETNPATSGRLPAAIDSTASRRLFYRLVSFAERVIEEPLAKNAPLKIDTAIELLKLAGPCSNAPIDRVNSRLRLGHAHLCAHKPELAAANYQEILSSAQLRGITLKFNPALLPPAESDEQGVEDANTTAGLIAQRCLNRLIVSMGKEIYASIEKDAAESLERAAAARDAGRVLEVALEFPNSDAAGSALLTHARWAAEQTDWATAAISYGRALRKKGLPDRAAAVREYVECLIAAGRLRVADQWLIRAIRDLPAYRFTKNRKTLSFADYRRRLNEPRAQANGVVVRHYREAAHAMRLSSFSRTYKRLFGERCSILDPLFSRLDATKWDGVLTWSLETKGSTETGQLEARSAVDGRALWSQPYEVAAQPVLLGMDEGRYILATQHSIFALSRRGGQLAWELGREPRPDPMSDPESETTWAHHVMTDSRLYSVSDDGEMWAIDLAEGTVRWRIAARLPVGSQMAANDTYVCYSAWEESNHSIVVLTAASGAKQQTIQPERDWPVQSLFLTPARREEGGSRDRGGSLLVVLSSEIQSYDIASGALRWQISTPDRYILSSLQLDEEGLIVSGDGRRLTKYALEDGEVIWSSPPLCAESGDNLWAEISDGWLVVAANDRLAVLDSADGRILWSAADSASLRLEPPRIVDDAILLISEERSKVRPKMRSLPGIGEIPDQKNAAEGRSEQEQGKRYRISVYDLQSGKLHKFADQEYLTTEPIESYGGVFVRDGAIILLDGQRLLGYVGN